jgi:prepilin-type N-terminal cleavage/methylation domain-containing protein
MLGSDTTRIHDTRARAASSRGFSLIELIMAMALTLIILGIAVAAFTGALGSREREGSRTDALTSAQAALNIMSREIGNAGYGLTTNGLVYADSNANQIHFRANVENTGSSRLLTDQPGEDVTFYCEACNGTTSGSVVKYDAVSGTSGIINRISDVDFTYYNYVYDPITRQVTVTPGAPGPDTGRVNIVLKVILADVQGQPSGRIERLSSDVTLRNSTYMLGLY